jgi:predicted lactoylglutathione lyase
MATVQQLFVNLPVKDLNRTVDFFTKVGFTFNQQFTDENATCMVLSESIQVMLLTEKFFGTFSDKKIIDAKTSTEAICALSVGSRDEVNELVTKAIDAGGREYKQLQDHGWMYTRCFEDLDGHQWEVFFMDMSAMPQG